MVENLLRTTPLFEHNTLKLENEKKHTIEGSFFIISMHAGRVERLFPTAAKVLDRLLSLSFLQLLLSFCPRSVAFDSVGLLCPFEPEIPFVKLFVCCRLKQKTL